MSEQYTYAVARIRALEVSLFSDSTIDQLIACQNYDQALQFLEEKGWGDAESSGDAEKILTREEEKTWEVVKNCRSEWNISMCFLIRSFFII